MTFVEPARSSWELFYDVEESLRELVVPRVERIERELTLDSNNDSNPSEVIFNLVIELFLAPKTVPGILLLPPVILCTSSFWYFSQRGGCRYIWKLGFPMRVAGRGIRLGIMEVDTIEEYVEFVVDFVTRVRGSSQAKDIFYNSKLAKLLNVISFNSSEEFLAAMYAEHLRLSKIMDFTSVLRSQKNLHTLAGALCNKEYAARARFLEAIRADA